MTTPNRERTLKVILVVLGIGQFGTSAFSFVGAMMRLPRSTATPMLESVLMTLGVFLVLAARNPRANRSLILYGAWANLAHAAVMAVMAIPVATQRLALQIPAALAGVAGALLLAFAPPPPVDSLPLRSSSR